MTAKQKKIVQYIVWGVTSLIIPFLKTVGIKSGIFAWLDDNTVAAFATFAVTAVGGFVTMWKSTPATNPAVIADGFITGMKKGWDALTEDQKGKIKEGISWAKTHLENEIQLDATKTDAGKDPTDETIAPVVQNGVQTSAPANPTVVTLSTNNTPVQTIQPAETNPTAAQNPTPVFQSTTGAGAASTEAK
jgi:hypothetical protein